MELIGLKEKLQGKFIKRYDLLYKTKDGKDKVYEVVTRQPVKRQQDLFASNTDGVAIVTFNDDRTKILLNKEFRPAVDKVVYNFPAGLIETGESVIDTVKREMIEETGLHVRDIKLYGRSYTALGISNETAELATCTADSGSPFGGNNNPVEEIEPVWVTKENARRIATEGNCSTRVQMVMLMWSENIF